MKASLYLLLATSLWGINFHFARVLLSEANFIEGGFWRYFFALIFLANLNFKKWPSFHLFKENYKAILMVGGAGLFGFNLFFFLGLQSTSAVNGALLMGLNPALTLIFSHFILKTTIKSSHILGITIAMFGVLYLLIEGDITHLYSLSFHTGDIMVFVGVVLFALHHVWVKKYANDAITNNEFTIMTAFTCVLLFALCIPLTSFSNITQHSNNFWWSAIGIGCMGTGFSYLLWNKGVKKIGANKAGIFVNMVPLSAGLSATLFGASLAIYHFISGLIIVFGLIIMQSSNFFGSKHT